MIQGGIVGGYYASKGWSPIFAVASDGERRVLELADWTSGGGDKPTIHQTTLGSFTVTSSDLSSGNATLTLTGPFININIAHTNSNGTDTTTTIDAIVNQSDKIRIVSENGQRFESVIDSKTNYTDRSRIRIRRADNPQADEVLSNFPVGTVITLTLLKKVYLGATGTVTVIADAVDIRGPQGE